jgi:putative peptide zinc metalloprotease protein
MTHPATVGALEVAAATPPERDFPATVPQLASGLLLLGRVQGSGHRTPPALVRRADGQTVQLTPLLYAILEAIDGIRTNSDIAELVAARTGRGVTTGDVHRLCAAKLEPLGLVTGRDGAQPGPPRANPLLALRLRWVVTNPTTTRRLTAPFAVLFAPLVVGPVLVAFAWISGWVLLTKGLASATYQAFSQPLLLLGVFAITIASAGFHELGHAAACRRGGATPGSMGTGLYLVWPAFFTDVTDSYRLGRGGRLRVDLGGLYFNAVVVVVMVGVWGLTRWDALLLIVASQLLQMVRQLMPMIRFDGYHALADLTGVPDLFGRIGPILRSLVPGRTEPRAAELKPWARAIVTAWVLALVPLLLVTVTLMALALPRLLGTAWHALAVQLGALTADWAGGDLVGVTVRMLALVAILLPVGGTLMILTRVVRHGITSTWRRTRGRPVQRAAAMVVGAALVAGLAWAWWPDAHRYRPVQPSERGTVISALRASATPTPPPQPPLAPGQLIAAPRSEWAATTSLPTRQEPQLALVLVPRHTNATGASTAAAPTWVFPFNRPGPPAIGNNQALAVNTTNGSTVYDVAFALVWADGSTVTNRNEAYAFAACTGCRTVAVAFQVVLVVGSANIVVPQNLSGAVNYSCAQCVTYALAQQLVLSIPGPLDPQTQASLEALWTRISTYASTIQNVPLDQVRAQLLAFQDQITALLTTVATLTPTATPTTPAATGTTGTTTGTPATAPTPTAPPSGDGPAASTSVPSGSSPAAPSPSSTSATPPPSDTPTAITTTPAPTDTTTTGP